MSLLSEIRALEKAINNLLDDIDLFDEDKQLLEGKKRQLSVKKGELDTQRAKDKKTENKAKNGMYFFEGNRADMVRTSMGDLINCEDSEKNTNYDDNIKKIEAAIKKISDSKGDADRKVANKKHSLNSKKEQYSKLNC